MKVTTKGNNNEQNVHALICKTYQLFYLKSSQEKPTWDKEEMHNM